MPVRRKNMHRPSETDMRNTMICSEIKVAAASIQDLPVLLFDVTWVAISLIPKSKMLIIPLGRDNRNRTNKPKPTEPTCARITGISIIADRPVIDSAAPVAVV